MYNAYCNECQTRVTLAEDGGCANGHPRSALRDVREGAIGTVPRAASTPTASVAAAQPAAARPVVAGASPSPNLQPAEERAAKIIGFTIFAIPATIICIASLWSSYALSMAMGMTKSASWWSSVGSLIFTIALLAIWVAKRRMKPHK